MPHDVKANAVSAIWIDSSQPQVEMKHRQLLEDNASREVDSNTQMMMSSCGTNTTKTSLTGSNTLDKAFWKPGYSGLSATQQAIDIQNFATHEKLPTGQPVGS